MKGKSIKIISSIIFILILVMLVSICSFAAEKPIELSLGHTGAGPENPMTIGGEVWASEIERLTGGRIIVHTFPSSQLGGERDLMEGIQAGTLDLYTGSVGVASNFIPEFAVFNMPFLFVSVEHVIEVLSGPIGKKLLAYADKCYNIKGLGLGGPAFRYPMNSIRPITKPDDFSKMKYRTMEIPMHLSTYRSFGATPVPVAFPELYTALKMGTVDGTEQAPVVARDMAFYEAQDYLTTLPVLVNSAIFVMNSIKFYSFSEKDQASIVEASAAAVKAFNEAMMERDKLALEDMEQRGMEIYRIAPDEIKPFIEASQVVWDEFLPTFSQEVQNIVLEIKKVGEKY